MIYIVMNQNTAWGAGKNEQDAITEAAKWLCDENGTQGISPKQVREMLISEYESRNGADGVFIANIDIDWNDGIENMDGDDLACMYMDNQYK